MYVIQRRSVVLPLLEVFDCPDSTVSSPSRSASTIAPQALALLNNAFVLQQSQRFARRALEEAGSAPADQAQRAFQVALGRKASERERALRYNEPPNYPRPVAEAWAEAARKNGDNAMAARAWKIAMEQYPGDVHAEGGLRGL